MALLHEATISPRKDELVNPWLTTRPCPDLRPAIVSG
jgi:hypothetical protein